MGKTFNTVKKALGEIINTWQGKKKETA